MNIIRFLFILSIFVAGYFLGFQFWQTNIETAVILIAIFAVVILLIEYLTSRSSSFYLISFILAFLTAALAALLMNRLVSLLNIKFPAESVVVFSFLGFLYLSFAATFKLIQTKFIASPKTGRSELIVVDTSAIIDGRIADLCATRFISARFLIPKFVLKELQQIADSHDPIKRTRGRRGLDVLNKMRKSKIEIVIDEHDFAEIREVDTKLIQLAKFYGASIFTTDYNLNKVAELQGVVVLNINDLANALKPVFLPGETMKIRVVKEGKEVNQGIGYLEDGTMVVVEDARRSMGNFLNVVVTSVLQTSAGRIIFTKKTNH